MKSVWKIFLVLTILVSFSAYFVPTVLAVNLNYCATLNTADTKYVLTNDVSHNDFGSCMRVVADNIILDCADNTITGPSNKNAIGMNIGADNFTMYNCTVTQFNQSVVTNGNHSWPMLGQNSNRTGTTDGVASGNFTKMWNFSTNASVTYSSPAVVDGVVYIGSSDTNLYAIYTNGTLKWNYSTGDIIESSPTVVDGVVYIGSNDNKLYAIYTNGTHKWNYTVGGDLYSAPAIADGAIYIASTDNNLSAVYINGSMRWNYSFVTLYPGASPTVADDVVYIGAAANLYAIHTNGTLKWNTGIDDLTWATPTVFGDVIYILSQQPGLNAIYTNGTLKWTNTYLSGSYPEFVSPTIAGETIYACTSGYLYAIYMNGTIQWELYGGCNRYTSPAVVDGMIYTSYYKNLTVVYPNGTIKWVYTANDNIRSSPAVVDGVVYFGSYDNNTYAIGHPTANATGAVIHNNTLSNANVSFVLGGYNNTFYDNYMSSIDLYYFYDVPDNGYDNHFNTTNSGKGAGYQAEGNYYDDYYTWKIIDSDGDGFADSGGDWPYNNSQTKWFGSGADWGPIIPGSAPAQPFVAITPSSGVLMDYFNCTFNHSDANNNPATITAKWINGTTTHSTETFTSVAVGDDRHIFLRPAIAHKGETWSCYIRACDAGDNCGEAFKNVTIGNSKPSLYEPANDSNTLLLVHFDEEHLYGMEGELGVSDQTPATSGGKTYGYIDTGTGFSYLYYNNTNGANLQYAAGTVEMWVQPQWDATDKAENVFFDTTASESWWSWFFTSRVRLMKDRNGGLECRMYPYYSKSVVARTGIRDWKSGEWHHIACTWDDSANTIKLYVDGELEKTTNWKYSLSFNPSYLHIGTDFNNQTKANAYIDEFRISDIARTSFPHAKALLTPANRTQLEVNATDIDWSNGTDRDGDTVKYKLAIYLEPEITAQKLNISYLNESDWGWDQETGVIESVNDGDDTLTDLDKNWETNQLSYIAKKTDKINITLQAGGTVVSNVSSNNATTITLDATDLSSVQAGDTYQISYTHLDDDVYYWLAQPHDGTEYGDRSDERIYFVIDAQPPSVHNSTYDPDPVYNNNDVNFSAIITGGPIDTVWYGYGQTCSLMTNYTGGISSSGDQYQILVHNSNFSNQGGFCFQWHANDIGAKYQAGELMPFTVQNRAPSVPNITGPTNATVFSDNGADTRNVIFNWTNSSDADMGNGCTGISCNGFTYLLYLSDYEFNVSSLENVTIQYNGTVNTTNIAVTSGTWYWLVSVDDYIDTNETNVSQFTFNTAPDVSWVKTYTTSYVETSLFPTETTVVIRANVSDSNNYTDISAVVINITDSNNVKKVINAQMTAVENLSLGRLYEYNLTLLTDWPSGEWTINITANDTLDQKGSNSTTFNVTYPDYRFDVRLYLNATTHIVYVPGTGELNASDLGGETNYSSPTHYYIASHLNNVVSGLVNYEGTFRKFYTENTTINHMIGLSQDFTNSKVFLAFTNGDWKRFEQQTTNLERKTFLNFVSPSFAYGLGLYLPIKILLEYSDIDIQGDQIIRKGYHEITLESNATGTQKALAIKRT